MQQFFTTLVLCGIFKTFSIHIFHQGSSGRITHVAIFLTYRGPNSWDAGWPYWGSGWPYQVPPPPSYHYPFNTNQSQIGSNLCSWAVIYLCTNFTHVRNIHPSKNRCNEPVKIIYYLIYIICHFAEIKIQKNMVYNPYFTYIL